MPPLEASSEGGYTGVGDPLLTKQQDQHFITCDNRPAACLLLLHWPSGRGCPNGRAQGSRDEARPTTTTCPDCCCDDCNRDRSWLHVCCCAAASSAGTLDCGSC